MRPAFESYPASRLSLRRWRTLRRRQAGDRMLDLIQDHRDLEWLLDHRDRGVSEQLMERGRERREIRGNEDEGVARCKLRIRHDSLKQLLTIHARHLVVQQHNQRAWAGAQVVEAKHPIGGITDRISFKLQQV